MNASDDTTDRRHTRAILAIILVSYFMILLDNSIIFTALPTVHTAMDFSSTGLAWVQDAYTLVFGGLLLLGARAGDLLGRRRVFVVGLAVFALASLLVGVAPTGWWLVVARGVQGVGAAIVAPSSLSLLTASFPHGESRAKAVALYGVLIAASARAGHGLVSPAAALTAHVDAALVAGGVLLGLCLLVTLTLILPTERAGGRRSAERVAETPALLAAATCD